MDSIYDLDFLNYYKVLIQQVTSNLEDLEEIKNVYRRNRRVYAEVDQLTTLEQNAITNFAGHIINRIGYHLKSQIINVAINAIDWLCSEQVIVQNDGAWGRKAGTDSRVANTLEVFMGLLEWQNILSNVDPKPNVLDDIKNRVTKAPTWLIRHQTNEGGLIGKAFDTPNVHNTAMFVWVISTFFPLLQNYSGKLVSWKTHLELAINWLNRNRRKIGGHTFDFFANPVDPANPDYKSESEARRTFSSIWALRALVAYSKLPDTERLNLDILTPDRLGQEISKFLESARTQSTHLLGHKVSDGQPSPAITGLVLTLLAEAKAANIPVKVSDSFQQEGIKYLFSTLKGPVNDEWVWDDEIEAFDQELPDRVVARSWTHVANPWNIQALSRYTDSLDQHQILVLFACVISCLNNQQNAGYFELLHGDDVERSNSVFGTALNLFALAQVSYCLENLNLAQGAPTP